MKNIFITKLTWKKNGYKLKSVIQDDKIHLKKE